MRCSAVIPVFNEASSLVQLHGELRQTALESGFELQIIFVDDGSTDTSWEVIESLIKRDAGVEAIRLRRNFGKAAALAAGFESARGEFVFTLDADLQDSPKEMPRFLEAMAQGFDVVSGWKRVRHDPWHKTLPSRCFNRLVGLVTGVQLHDHNCGFKCYRREVLAEVQLYGEMHRFVPVLAASRGFRITEIPVEHRPRQFGRSKYGFERFLKGLLDLMTVYFLTGFRQRPQHLLGGIGLVAFLSGAAGLTYLAGYWAMREFGGLEEEWIPLHQRPLVLYCLGGLLLGAQLLSIGFLAELLTAQQSRSIASYSVKSRRGQACWRSEDASRGAQSETPHDHDKA